MTVVEGIPTVFEALAAPVTVLVGHFGSGKTEIAVNLAFGWQERGERVTLVDLDLIKPYFRSRLVRDELARCSIDLIVPDDDRFYADLPILLPDVRASIGRGAAAERRVILDVGGAVAGSRVLGAVAGLTDPAVADVLFVVNGNRPFAETPVAVLDMLQTIEQASRLRVTGLVANTHLMEETTPEIVRQGLDLTGAVSEAAGVPIRFCAVLGRLEAAVQLATRQAGLPVLPLSRRITAPHDPHPVGLRRRSSVV
jgi:hypothetical protein